MMSADTATNEEKSQTLEHNSHPIDSTSQEANIIGAHPARLMQTRPLHVAWPKQFIKLITPHLPSIDECARAFGTNAALHVY